MKLTTLIVLLNLSFLSALPAQEKYHVLHVKGEVKVKSSNEVLAPKDQIDAKEQLVFSSDKDVVAVISTKRGRYILKPKVKSGKSELTAFIDDIIEPVSGKLSSRSVIASALEFQKYFDGSHVFLSDTATFNIADNLYKIDDEHFFFLKYDYNGESINKKISQSPNTLHFIEKEIYTVDDQQIDKNSASNFQLYYYDSVNQSATLISSLYLYFPEDDELVDTLSLLSSMTKGSKKEKVEEMENYLNDTYGKVISSDLDKFIVTHGIL